MYTAVLNIPHWSRLDFQELAHTHRNTQAYYATVHKGQQWALAAQVKVIPLIIRFTISVCFIHQQVKHFLSNYCCSHVFVLAASKVWKLKFVTYCLFSKLSWSPMITAYRNASLSTEKKRMSGADLTHAKSCFYDVWQMSVLCYTSGLVLGCVDCSIVY